MSALSGAVAPGHGCAGTLDENIDSEVETREANQALVAINHVWRGQKVAVE